MAIGKFFKKHLIKILVGFIAASSLTYGVVSYINKSDENELLRQKNKANIEATEQATKFVKDVSEKYDDLFKKYFKLSETYKEAVGKIIEDSEKYDDLFKKYIKLGKGYIELSEDYKNEFKENNQLLKKNNKLFKDNIQLHKQSIEDVKKYTDLLAKHFELNEKYLKATKSGLNSNKDEKLEELKKKHRELNKLYDQLVESGKLNSSIEKTKIINKTDCSSLELICFRETSKDIKHNYSNQQGTYSKMFAKKGDKGLNEGTSNGIFITNDGFFLTNYHSYKDDLEKDVEREFYVFIPTPNKCRVLELNIIAYSKYSDLALFKIDEKIVKKFKEKSKFKNITLSKSTSNLIFKYLPSKTIWMEPDFDIKSFKHPLTEVKIKNVERKFGRYFVGSELFLDHYLETKEFVAKKGMSGSPLYDSSGNLAGIANSKTYDSSRFVSSDVIFSFLQDCIYSQKTKNK